MWGGDEPPVAAHVFKYFVCEAAALYRAAHEGDDGVCMTYVHPVVTLSALCSISLLKPILCR